jgi:hypothetical protein
LPTRQAENLVHGPSFRQLGQHPRRLRDRVIEVYANPRSTEAGLQYDAPTVYGIDASVPLIVDGQHLDDIEAKSILADPPAA